MEYTKRWDKRLPLLFLVPLFLYYSYFCGQYPTFILPNAWLAADQAIALYERKELNIDDDTRQLGWGRSPDTVRANGKIYPNKFPGASLCLFFVAPLVDALTPGTITAHQLLYLGRVLVLTLPFIIFLYCLGRRLEKMVPSPAAWGLVLCYALGTNASVYAVDYFSHNLAAMAYGAAFLILWWENPKPKHLILAGLASGFGVLIEFSSLVIPLALALLIVITRGKNDRLKSLFLFFLGVIPSVIVLLLYNYKCFGNPFSLPYDLTLSQKAHRTFISCLSYPKLKALFGILLSPARGLFYQSPWLLAVLPSLFFIRRASLVDRSFLITAVSVSLLQSLIISSYTGWPGGWGVGPRYLTVCLPFLLFPIAVLIRHLKKKWLSVFLTVFIAAAIVSIIEHAFILISVDYHPSFRQNLSTNYIKDLALPFLAKGYSAYTVVNFFGGSVELSRSLFALLLSLALGTYAMLVWKKASSESKKVICAGSVLGIALFGLWLQTGVKNPELQARIISYVLQRNYFDNSQVHRYSFWNKGG